MANDEPAYLSKGVEVSAKYRGAFCEAKVTNVEKCVKCKVILKEDSKQLVVSDDDIKGIVKIGATVEVKKPDTGQYVEAVVSRVNDHSLYTVVFDDGDRETLRRSKLCLKGDRHFMKSETLDDLPLTNPEHFGTPVIRKTSVNKSTKNNTTYGSDDCSESPNSSDDDSDSRSGSQSKSVTNEREYPKALQDFVGQVICVEADDRTKKSTTIPVLVVQSTADDIPLPSSSHLLVKSFKDNKFLTTTLGGSRLYSPSFASAKAAACKDKIAKFAWEKALQYVERQELPPSWDRDQLLGEDVDSDEMSDCEVPPMDERRDRFVAQLYKFMEDRGTPLNKAPMLENLDLDLFHMFHLVSNMGGYNRVNNVSRWSSIYLRMKLPCSLTVNTAAKHVREAYERYLHAYEDFNRKLGCTLVSTTGRPERGRHPSSRSLLSFRDRTDRLSDIASKSAGRLSGKRPVSVKDEVTPGVKDKQFKEEATKELDDMEKADKSDTKSDDSFRATRKTPKRTQLDAPKLSPVSEFKINEDTARTKDSPDAVSSGKKVEPEMVKLVRQRRPSAIMRLTRGDALKPRSDVTTVSMGNKEERVNKKNDICPSFDERSDKKLISSKVSIMKDDNITKKKFSDIADVSEEKKSNRTDSKRSEHGPGEKSFSSKRPLLRRTSAATSDSSGTKSSDKMPSNDGIGAPSGLESSSSNRDEERDNSRVISSKAAVGEEGHPLGTRLTVRYGKGNNQKTYEAKVIEVKRLSSGAVEYLVHYAGWNTRYDEWIRRDAIVAVLEEPSDAAPAVVVAPPSVTSKSRHLSIGSIISQAAEKKKTPFFRSSSRAISSINSSSSVKAGKIRKATDSGGADSEDSVKRQKRLPSLDGNKSQTKFSAGRGRHRRTRTRSRTMEAGESNSEGSSSSSEESDSDLDLKDPLIASAEVLPGSPVTSPSKSLYSNKSLECGDADTKLIEMACSVDIPVASPSSEKGKSIVESLVNETDVGVLTASSDRNIAACADVKVENVSIEDEPSIYNSAITESKDAPVLDVKSSCPELPSLVCSVPSLGKNPDERDTNRTSFVSGECVPLDREPTHTTSEGDLSLSFEMPDLTKSTDDDSNTESRTEEKQFSRGRKRIAGESTDKPEKKGKAEGKRKLKEDLTSGKEADEKVDFVNEVNKDVVSKVSGELKQESNSTESNTVPKQDYEENQVIFETESNVSDVDKADPKLSTLKKSKQSPDSDSAIDKRLKIAAVGKNEEKKETRGKKKGKVNSSDIKLLDSTSQDSATSEVESGLVKDQISRSDNQDASSSSAEALESLPKDNAEVSTHASTSSVPTYDETVFVKAEDIIQFTDCTEQDLNVAATEWTGVNVDIDGQELTEGAARLDCYNVFEVAAKSIQGNCVRQVETEEDTLSMLRSSCQQNIAAFTDSPPDTSGDEFGQSASGGSASPQGQTCDADEEHTSTKSELEANMEVAAYMGAASNDGELSSDEDGDSGEILNQASVSPVNIPLRHGHLSKGDSIKRKGDENREDSFSSGKRLKKEKQPHQHHHRTRSNHNRLMAIAKTSSHTTQASDSEDVDSPSAHVPKLALASGISSHRMHHTTHRNSIKYNFLDLDEAHRLEGEQRISFLMSRIQELRQVYMDLKTEVACIDRRRRRHRCKERDVQTAHVLANSSSIAIGGALSNL